MRNKLAYSATLALALCGVACRQDMHIQPAYRPLDGSEFFSDQRSARPQVEGTVARGQLHLDEARYTGKVGDKEVEEFPFPITRADLERGQERFNIYCSPCHDRVGDGNGLVVQRGFRQAASYYSERVLKEPIGHYFDVITNGFGAMPAYNTRVAPDDRWRVIAYIRALQLSEFASLNDVPTDMRDKLTIEPPPLQWESAEPRALQVPPQMRGQR